MADYDRYVTLSPTTDAAGWRRIVGSSGVAVASTLVSAAAWLVIQPPVNDLWAARARESAARAGVGLHYWFGWFSGMVPGNYSALLPWAYRVADAAILGAVATIVSVILTRLVAADTTHPVAATWCAALTLSANLWAARIPFAIGTVAMLLTWWAIRQRRPWLASTGGVLAALITPVCGVFAAFGLFGVFWHDRSRRWQAAACATATGTCLAVLGWYFGMPGPQGYDTDRAILSVCALFLLLAARPATPVRTVVLASLVALPLLIWVPNGMGENFARFIWIVLPAAVAATGRAPRWRILIASFAVSTAAIGYSARDVLQTALPDVPASSYSALIGHLAAIGDRDDYRLQVAYDATHTYSSVMLGVVPLATGWETQAQHDYHAVLLDPNLDAADYRQWLEGNAVRWVAIPRHPHSPGPEYQLVRNHTPDYLELRFADPQWLLYEVNNAFPIVDTPARVNGVAQATMTITAPEVGDYELRVHYSRFLHVRQRGAVVEPSGDGWSRLVVERPGTYVISG